MFRSGVIFILAVGLLAVVFPSETQIQATPGGEIKLYPSLWDSFDPVLKSTLEKRLKQKAGSAFQQMVWTEKVGVVVVDITNEMRPKVAGIHPDVMLYAASLPKIAIALGAFVKIDQGTMFLDSYLKSQLTNMIRNSSNEAASAVLYIVGLEDLAAILQSDRYRLYDQQRNGGLWVGKNYSGGAVWKRDPLHNLTHGATAMQAARLYYLAVTGRLVKKEHRADFLEIFSKSGINHKFVRGLKLVNPAAEIYCKSGTLGNFHADSAKVVTDKHKYILVVIAEHHQAGQTLVKLAGVVDDILRQMHPDQPNELSTNKR